LYFHNYINVSISSSILSRSSSPKNILPNIKNDRQNVQNKNTNHNIPIINHIITFGNSTTSTVSKNKNNGSNKNEINILNITIFPYKNL
jgi:hypothetical protein